MEGNHYLAVMQQKERTILSSLFLNTDTADVFLLCQEDSYKLPAHRCVLAAASSYFKAMLFGGMKESSQLMCDLQMSHSSEVVMKMLEFIYLGQVSISTAQVPEVIIAADYLNLESLLLAVESTVQTQLNPMTCCSLLHHLYGEDCTYAEVPMVMSKIQDLCYQYLHSNLQSVVLLDEAFSLLPLKVLCRLVGDSHSLAGVSKLDMYRVVCKWLKHHEHTPYVQETAMKLLAEAQKTYLGVDRKCIKDSFLQSIPDIPQKALLPFPMKPMSPNVAIVYSNSLKKVTVECKQAESLATQVPLVALSIEKEMDVSCSIQLVKIGADCQHECREFRFMLIPLNSTENIVQAKVPITGLSKSAKVSLTRNLTGSPILDMASCTTTLSLHNAYILTIGASCSCISFALNS